VPYFWLAMLLVRGQVMHHDSDDDIAEFSFQCCRAVLTSSSSTFPRSSAPSCFILSGNDVIEAVRYLAALGRLVWLLFGPALLLHVSSLRGRGHRMHYVVPLPGQLRKSIYVRKVRVDRARTKTSKQRDTCSSDHTQGRHDTSGQFSQVRSQASVTSQRRENSRGDDPSKQFARFRQLVKKIPSDQIVDVSKFMQYTFIFRIKQRKIFAWTFRAIVVCWNLKAFLFVSDCDELWNFFKLCRQKAHLLTCLLLENSTINTEDKMTDRYRVPSAIQVGC